jgi:hypothetical protein
MGREGFGTQVPDWRIAVRIREVSELAKEFGRLPGCGELRDNPEEAGWFRGRLAWSQGLLAMTMLQPPPSSRPPRRDP